MRLGHQHRDGALVPQFVLADITLHFGADRGDFGRGIEMQEHRPGQHFARARPVFEAFFKEPRRWHHHSAFIPCAHDDEGHVDFFHPARVPVHHHHVTQPQRLGHGDLEARNQRFEGRLRGGTHGQRGKTGRGEQRRADALHCRDREQHQTDGDEDDRKGCGAGKDRDARAAAAYGDRVDCRIQPQFHRQRKCLHQRVGDPAEQRGAQELCKWLPHPRNRRIALRGQRYGNRDQ